MDVWIENFTGAGYTSTAVSLIWMLALRFRRLNKWLAAVVRLIMGTMLMVVSGAAISFVVHSFELNAFAALVEDPLSGTAYFAETGLETTVFWFPVVLIGSILTLFRKRGAER